MVKIVSSREKSSRQNSNFDQKNDINFRNTNLSKTVVLVGLMGTGKTTIGRRLASMAGSAFMDSDQEIEKAAQMSVAEIFETLGEAEFRSGERRVIARLLNDKPMILAVGGGAFIDQSTRELICKKAVSVWLDAPIEVLVRRTGKRDTRPLLKSGDPKAILSKLARERNPIYRRADIHVESSSGSHEKVVRDILDRISNLVET